MVRTARVPVILALLAAGCGGSSSDPDGDAGPRDGGTVDASTGADSAVVRATHDGPAELPRVSIDTTLPALTGTSVSVNAGGDVQAAIDAAACGDTIRLQAGATFTGNFRLPVKTCPTGQWVVITTTATDLPAPGTRARPIDAAKMPKLVTAISGAVLSTASAAHHYRLIGLEITSSFSGANTHALIEIGGSETAEAMLPHDIVVDRCYLHGSATLQIKRGVLTDGRAIAVIDSTIEEIHNVGQDSQAIAGFNGVGPIKIANNRLEGSSENIIFGGADPALANAVTADIEILGNHIVKPRSWNDRDPSFSGQDWSIKNLFELKNATRVLVEGNVLENNWVDGQSGWAIVLTPRNQDGGCPWCEVSDVTFRHNVVAHTANGVNILGGDDLQTSKPFARLSLHDNLFVDVGAALWGGGGKQFQLLTSATQSPADVTISHNTTFNGNSFVTAESGPPTVPRFVFVNNLVENGLYGAFCGGTLQGTGSGSVCLDFKFPGHRFQNNLRWGTAGGSYPAGNLLAADQAAVGFVDAASCNGGTFSIAACALAAGSPGKSAATDGKDIGADIAALAIMTANVR